MPAQAKWAIRFYVPFDDDNESITFVGSFDNAGARYLDDIEVYSGMYGLPDYMIWYIHKDLEAYNFSKYSIDLRLYTVGDKDYLYWTEQYRVINVSFDEKLDKYVLYAVQEDYAKLRVPLLDFGVSALPYDETRGRIVYRYK